MMGAKVRRQITLCKAFITHIDTTTGLILYKKRINLISLSDCNPNIDMNTLKTIKVIFLLRNFT